MRWCGGSLFFGTDCCYQSNHTKCDHSQVTLLTGHSAHRSLRSPFTLLTGHSAHRSLRSPVTLLTGHSAHRSLCSPVTLLTAHSARRSLSLPRMPASDRHFLVVTTTSLSTSSHDDSISSQRRYKSFPMFPVDKIH